MIFWEELVGFTVDEVVTVDVVMDEFVKTSDGNKWRFEYPVDSEVFESDEAVIFTMTFTEEDTRKRIAYFEQRAAEDEKYAEMAQSSRDFLAVLERAGGVIRSHKLLINEQVYEIEQV